ncbi:MAG: hypothetical protein DWQ34_27070 [Planctomycetota bacterium]|nr:MAG: hypothetical protein DWQ34_27070 [Planctomycetota bacterium]REK29136.1 MAG: hypothetical protein DWQ45_23635 [Planctomycetota bacterium]
MTQRCNLRIAPSIQLSERCHCRSAALTNGSGDAFANPHHPHIVNNQVLSVAFRPDGARIVSGSEDKTVGVWNAVTPGWHNQQAAEAEANENGFAARLPLQ